MRLRSPLAPRDLEHGEERLLALAAARVLGHQAAVGLDGVVGVARASEARRPSPGRGRRARAARRRSRRSAGSARPRAGSAATTFSHSGALRLPRAASALSDASACLRLLVERAVRPRVGRGLAAGRGRLARGRDVSVSRRRTDAGTHSAEPACVGLEAAADVATRRSRSLRPAVHRLVVVRRDQDLARLRSVGGARRCRRAPSCRSAARRARSRCGSGAAACWSRPARSAPRSAPPRRTARPVLRPPPPPSCAPSCPRCRRRSACPSCAGTTVRRAISCSRHVGAVDAGEARACPAAGTACRPCPAGARRRSSRGWCGCPRAPTRGTRCARGSWP